jgi:hypothetical protein
VALTDLCTMPCPMLRLACLCTAELYLDIGLDEFCESFGILHPLPPHKSRQFVITPCPLSMLVP